MDMKDFIQHFSCADTLEEAIAIFSDAKDFVDELSCSDSGRAGREANHLCCRLLHYLAEKADLSTWEGRQAFIAAAESIAAPWQILSADLETVKEIFDEDGDYECIDAAAPGEAGAYERLAIDGARGGVQWDNEVPETLAGILDLNFEDREGSFIWYNSKES